MTFAMKTLNIVQNQCIFVANGKLKRHSYQEIYLVPMLGATISAITLVTLI